MTPESIERALVGTEHVGLTDEARLVGVEDVPAVAVPDLHADERVVEYVAPHDAVDPRDRSCRSGEQRVGDGGLDEALRLDHRGRPRVGDRFAFADSPAGD